MGEHRTHVRVRYADTDQSGAVYHAAYLRWFEAGRSEAMRDHGIPYSETEARGINLPVIDLHVRYHRPALYDQLLEVRTHVASLTRTRIQFAYRLVLPGDRRPLATATTVHPFVDRDGRVLRLDRYPDLWERIQRAARDLCRDA